MEEAIQLLGAKGPKERLKGLSVLQEAVDQGDIELDSLDEIVDGLAAVLTDNNFKVCLNGLTALAGILPQCGAVFRPYIPILWGALSERLGDGHTGVREKAYEVVLTMVDELQCAEVFDRVKDGFTHKNPRVKEQSLGIYAYCLENYGPALMHLKKNLNSLVRLLEDPSSVVRDSAVDALETVYKFMGPRLRDTLQANNVRPGQLKLLNERFDAVELDPILVEGPESEGTVEEAAPAPAPAAKKASPKEKRVSSAPVGRAFGGSGTVTPQASGEDMGLPKEVKAVQVYSEKDLQKEFEALAVLLNGQKADWNARLNGLKRIQGLIVGGGADWDNFGQCLKLLREPICSQLQDLRSSIVKETCNTIAMISRTIGVDFDREAEVVLPYLYKLVYVTIQIISESSTQCIRVVIQHTQSHRLVPKVLESLNSTKNSALRTRLAENLRLMLESWAFEVYEKHIDAICDAVKKNVADALADVRKAGRGSFAAIKRVSEEHAQRMYATFDAQTQKTITSEANGVSGDGAAPKRASTKPKRFVRPAPVKKPVGGDEIEIQISAGPGRPISAPSASPRSRQSPRKETAAAPARKGPQRVVAGENTSGVANAASMSSSGGASAGPQRAAKSAGGGGGAKRVIVDPASEDGGAGISSKPVRVQQVEYSSARPVRSGSDGALNGSSGPASPTKRPSSYGESSKDKSEKPREPCTDLAILLTEANASLWSVRMNCFNDLKLLYGTGRGSEILSNMDKIVHCYENRLSDSHHKVLEAVLDSLVELFRRYTNIIDWSLEKLLPKLLVRWTDAKAVIRDGTEKVIGTLLELYEAERFVPQLLKIIDSSTAKSRISCAQLLSLVVASNAEFYTASASAVKSTMVKLVPYIQDKNSDLRKYSLRTMLTVYEHNPQAFLQQILAQPVSTQNNLKRVLVPVIPDLDNLLGMAARIPTAGKAKAAPASGYGAASPRTSKAGQEEVMVPRRAERSDGYSSKKYGQADDGANGDLHVENSTSRHDIRPTYVAANVERSVEPGAGRASLSERQRRSLDLVEGTAEVTQDTIGEIIADMEGSPATRKAAMIRIISLSSDNNPKVWVKNFSQILLVILEAIRDPSSGPNRELALQVLQNMLRFQSVSFVEYLDMVIRRLLECNREQSREVRTAAEDTIDLLVKALDPVRVLDILTSVVQNEDNAVLQGAIRAMTKLLPNVSKELLNEYLPRILPGLFMAFKHTSADIRKAVVFCLVDMYLVLGDELTPKLSELSTSQLKLVTIYINRAIKDKNPAA